MKLISIKQLAVLASACAFIFAGYTASAADIPSDVGPNLALKKPYEGSDPNTKGWNGGLTDGDWTEKKTHTFATGSEKKFPKTVTVDLKKSEKIAYVHIGVPAFGSTKTIAISLSDDGKKFTEVGKHTFKLRTSEKKLFSFDPEQARYVRLTFEQNYSEKVNFGTTYCFLTEVEVYGKKK